MNVHRYLWILVEGCHPQLLQSPLGLPLGLKSAQQYSGKEPSVYRSGAISIQVRSHQYAGLETSSICKSTTFKPNKCQCPSRLVGRNSFLRNIHVPQLQGIPDLGQQAYPVRRPKGFPDFESQWFSPQESNTEKPHGDSVQEGRETSDEGWVWGNGQSTKGLLCLKHQQQLCWIGEKETHQHTD